jgi:drug/metabolite transporter (DMT)-like permease
MEKDTSTAAPTHGSGVASLEMVLCTFLWGGFFVAGKLAAREGAPLVIATLRFAFAGALLLGLLAWREPSALRVGSKDLAIAFGLGATGVAAYNALAFFGFARAPGADGAMISPTLNPVVTLALARVFFGERLAPRRLAGLALAIAGVALVFGGALTGGASGGARLSGDLLFVGSALAWSAYTILGRLAVKRFSALASTCYASVTGFLILLPFSLGELQRVTWRALSPSFWGSLAFLVVFATIGAFLLWYGALQRIGAARTASYLPLVPIFGVAQGMAVLGERPQFVQVVGMALGVAGVWWANRR